MKEKDEKFVDWATAMAEAKANLPRVQEMAEVIMGEYAIKAKVMRHCYLRLVGEGFTKEEALSIIKEHGWLGK